MSDTKYQITKTVRFKLIPNFADDTAKRRFVSDCEGIDRDTSTMSKEETQVVQPFIEEMENLDSIIAKVESIKQSVNRLLFCSEKYGMQHHTIFNNFKITRSWLMRYLKISFYDFLNDASNVKTSYKLSELPFLIPAFKQSISNSELSDSNIPEEIKMGWFYRIEQLLEELKKVKIVKSDNKKDDNRHRKTAYPNIALVLNDLNKRNNLEFIKEFVEQLIVLTQAIDAKSKEKKNNIEILIDGLKSAIKNLEEELQEKIKFFLPYQSEGRLVCSGSLNYYTVNKSPKELETEEQTIVEKLNADYVLDDDFVQKYKLSLDDAIAVLAKQFNKDKSKITTEKNLKWPLSLENTFLYLCYWRNQQKVKFQEKIDKYNKENGKNHPNKQILREITDAIRENPLYKVKNGFVILDYAELRMSITKLATEINNEKDPEKKKTLSDKLVELKAQQKTFWSFDPNPENSGKDKFKRDVYNGFIDKFNEVADEFGKYNAQKKAIEKDKVISQQVGYWCVIVEKEGKKYLYLIPRDGENSLTEVHEEITKIAKNKDTNTQTGSNVVLFYFESLTFRALQKLCYKSYDNTFREQFKDIIPECEYDNDAINGVEAPEDKDKIRIDIYKKVLQRIRENNIESVFLDYNGIDDIINTDYSKIEDFETALTRVCYAKKVAISDDIENKLKNAICFEITSQDLIFRQKNDGKNVSNLRFATLIWDQFWSENNQNNNFDVRLNPEIKIFYREPKPSRVIKYGDDTERFNPDWKNRYLHDQFTVAFSVTENAINPHLNYAFENLYDQDSKTKRVQNVQDKIVEFNRKISNIGFALGIDVGNDSLAFVASCDKELKPMYFDVLTIKDLHYHKSNAVLNERLACEGKKLRKKIYYYQDKPEYFTNKELYNEIFADGLFEKTQEEINNGALTSKEGNMIYFVKDNPSYFLNVEQYHKTFTGLDLDKSIAEKQMQEDFEQIFEKNKVTAIDLTNAKVVKGYIVVNGDVSSHLKLKELKAERQLAKLFQKDFMPSTIDIFVDTDENGKKYIKTKNNILSKYLISRKDNDKVTDFTALYSYIQSDKKASTNHLKGVTFDNADYIFELDDKQNIILKKIISQDLYECLNDEERKNKVLLENRIIKTKNRIKICAFDTKISIDNHKTIVEIPKNPKNPAKKDTLTFDESLFEDFDNFRNEILNRKSVRLPKSIELADELSKVEKEFPSGNIINDNDVYYITKTLFDKNNEPIYSEVLEEFYEKNYNIESTKKNIEKIRKSSANFTESVTDDSIVYQYSEISKLYIEESDKKYANIVTIEQIKDTLTEFKDEQKLELARVVEKINNYRKALVANMVGVLLNIYQQCKNGKDCEGLISFEGLTKSDIDKDFAVFEGNITVPLRIALLQKLQEFGLVPPFAEVNKLSNPQKFVIEPNEEDKKETSILTKGDCKRYGIISFVNADKTSQCCPLCGKVVNKKDKNYPYENKAGIGHADNFMCYPKNSDDKCGFCTERDKFTNIDISKIDSALHGLSETDLIDLFSSLDCNDKLASYNIAKRAIWNI